jgi:5-methylcytosine-specific restriction endonuclease McrBC regulatory subunit McrC
LFDFTKNIHKLNENVENMKEEIEKLKIGNEKSTKNTELILHHLKLLKLVKFQNLKTRLKQNLTKLIIPWKLKNFKHPLN